MFGSVRLYQIKGKADVLGEARETSSLRVQPRKGGGGYPLSRPEPPLSVSPGDCQGSGMQSRKAQMTGE